MKRKKKLISKLTTLTILPVVSLNVACSQSSSGNVGDTNSSAESLTMDSLTKDAIPPAHSEMQSHNAGNTIVKNESIFGGINIKMNSEPHLDTEISPGVRVNTDVDTNVNKNNGNTLQPTTVVPQNAAVQNADGGVAVQNCGDENNNLNCGDTIVENRSIFGGINLDFNFSPDIKTDISPGTRVNTDVDTNVTKNEMPAVTAQTSPETVGKEKSKESPFSLNGKNFAGIKDIMDDMLGK